MKYNSVLQQVKQNSLVFDLETSAFYPDGREINLNTNYEDYIEHADIKWFGAWSYRHNKGYCYDCTNTDNLMKVIELLNDHKILIGFNNKEFDIPIAKNNGLLAEDAYPIIVDCMVTLGRSVFNTRDGYRYKDRGTLMGYKFKNNSLRTMAETMGLETQKGDIDYRIFQKNSWTLEEIEQIKTYLKSDVMATKQMFDKLWEYWLPFADMLNEKNVRDLSWIRSSIASLTYRCACNFIDVDPTYSEKKSISEDMGGFVLDPQIEEETDVFICDWASLYPHIYTSTNLFGECEPDDTNPFAWHGNSLFQVKGYYNTSKPHPLNLRMQEILKERIRLKKEDKDNPMIYAYKIFLNSYYGASRSSIFEQIHTPNCGYDCCFLGQQINAYTKKRLEEFGFRVIYQDTDSCFCKHDSKNNHEYLNKCLEIIVTEIKNNLPFKIDTFNIEIEKKVDYILFPFSLQPIQDKDGNNIKVKNRLVKKLKGNKKNYLFLHNNEITIKGLPIIKEGSTELSTIIYEKELKPLILKNKKAKFDRKFISDLVDTYLQNNEIMKLMAREFKCKPFHIYKNESQLQAQISKEYFHCGDGAIELIKNNKIGNVGKTDKYCTVEEAIKNKLTSNDLNLDKLWNELGAFIKNEN